MEKAKMGDGRTRYGRKNGLNGKIEWYWVGISDGIELLQVVFEHCQCGIEC